MDGRKKNTQWSLCCQLTSPGSLLLLKYFFPITFDFRSNGEVIFVEGNGRKNAQWS